ncbi:hypothetical protein POTOM_025231 [Populus tomentosa]|uniref:Uncharacterized protein n=1 Tax=Populus tomentosa TaxID=118781 RepID=A0A8X8CNG5_POPTO|nr:hypothetical protein POTOM_025231 [Populus tomentosa]
MILACSASLDEMLIIQTAVCGGLSFNDDVSANGIAIRELTCETTALVGELPEERGGRLFPLQHIILTFNYLGGKIPTNLTYCTDIRVFGLAVNKFIGEIPDQLSSLTKLGILGFGGLILVPMSNASALQVLDFAQNGLTVIIPRNLEGCFSLERLYLEGNKFEAPIPGSLKTSRGLEELDLSKNNLIRRILEFLGKLLALKHLNLSCNDLETEVSRERTFANASAIPVFGNDKLYRITFT